MRKALTLDALKEACRAAAQSLLEHDAFDAIHIPAGRREEFMSRVREDRRAAIWGVRIVEAPHLRDTAVLTLRGEIVRIINLPGMEPKSRNA